MQQITLIYTVSLSILLLAIVCLLLLYKKKKTDEHLYHDAMKQESDGRYKEAINLYEKYLDRTGKTPDLKNQEVHRRIKTLRILTVQ